MGASSKPQSSVHQADLGIIDFTSNVPCRLCTSYLTLHCVLFVSASIGLLLTLQPLPAHVYSIPLQARSLTTDKRVARDSKRAWLGISLGSALRISSMQCNGRHMSFSGTHPKVIKLGTTWLLIVLKKLLMVWWQWPASFYLKEERRETGKAFHVPSSDFNRTTEISRLHEWPWPLHKESSLRDIGPMKPEGARGVIDGLPIIQKMIGMSASVTSLNHRLHVWYP